MDFLYAAATAFAAFARKTAYRVPEQLSRIENPREALTIAFVC
jgi:hypothetical protein